MHALLSRSNMTTAWIAGHRAKTAPLCGHNDVGVLPVNVSARRMQSA